MKGSIELLILSGTSRFLEYRLNTLCRRLVSFYHSFLQPVTLLTWSILRIYLADIDNGLTYPIYGPFGYYYYYYYYYHVLVCVCLYYACVLLLYV